jgi:hypothetical protein
MVPTDTDAGLIESGWLYRSVYLAPPYDLIVEYNGRGLGHETVLVDGTVVSRMTSLLWFVPRFEFQIGPDDAPFDAVVEVRVWPWLCIRKFRILVGEECVYREGDW